VAGEARLEAASANLQRRDAFVVTHGDTVRSCRRALVPALLVAACSVATPSAGQERVAGRVQAALDSLVAASGAPGATLGLVLPDGRALGFASGMADTARHEPLTSRSLMLEGSLALDSPISRVLGEVPWLDRIAHGREMTLRQLMSHTSGLVRYELDPRFLADLTADPLRTFTPEERLAYLFDAEPPFAPGEGWDYADTNYIVVARLIEKVTGRTAYDEIRRRLLTPLALVETTPSDRPAIPGLAQGYAGPGNPFGGFDEMVRDGRMRINPQFEWGGGGFASSARDLARWMHVLQRGGAFDASLMDAYRDGHPAPLGPQASYGLGVIMMRLPAGRAWGHSGMMPGYRTEAYHFPDHGFTLALQVNSSDQAALRMSPLRMLDALAAVVASATR
jgi:D-alanyl-D-alanine carboxypeptidase